MPTLRLDEKTWLQIEEACVELTIIKRKPVTVPELTKQILKDYAKVAIDEIIKKEIKKKER